MAGKLILFVIILPIRIADKKLIFSCFCLVSDQLAELCSYIKTQYSNVLYLVTMHSSNTFRQFERKDRIVEGALAIMCTSPCVSSF